MYVGGGGGCRWSEVDECGRRRTKEEEQKPTLNYFVLHHRQQPHHRPLHTAVEPLTPHPAHNEPRYFFDWASPVPSHLGRFVTYFLLTTRPSHSQCTEHSVPPTLLATLISAQHMRPFQPLPMTFPVVLLFSSYLNLSGFKSDAAGITAAWSGLYALLALRRKQVSRLFHH